MHINTVEKTFKKHIVLFFFLSEMLEGVSAQSKTNRFVGPKLPFLVPTVCYACYEKKY